MLKLKKNCLIINKTFVISKCFIDRLKMQFLYLRGWNEYPRNIKFLVAKRQIHMGFKILLNVWILCLLICGILQKLPKQKCEEF